MKYAAGHAAEGNGVAEDFPLHRKKAELLWTFRYYARLRDEDGFKDYLSEKLGIRPEDERYAAALSAFWNLVRAIENEPRR